MGELTRELQERMAQVQRSLAEARLASDDYLQEVLLGELEELHRVARDHGVELPAAEQPAA